jgi:AraC-like DNA-binding protein/ligand-binding sensor protein
MVILATPIKRMGGIRIHVIGSGVGFFFLNSSPEDSESGWKSAEDADTEEEKPRRHDKTGSGNSFKTGLFRVFLTPSMNQSLFDALSRSRVVRSYEEAFHTATGFVLKLQPAVEIEDLNPFGDHANPFCRMMGCSPQAKEVCNRTFAAIRNKASKKGAPGKACCFAGITHLAIPVISAGEHIATMYGGQFMLEKPTKQNFEKVSRNFVRMGLGNQLKALEHAWFHTPVVSEKKLQAILYLLETFAERISRHAATMLLEPIEGEPATVTRARKFIDDRFAEPITMPDAARHLRMSPSTFSKVFKRAVGITFTQYVARVRVEKSKSMLANPSAPVRNIAFQSGFDSISQFNRSFRQYAEMSPSQYRESLKGVEHSLSA